MERRQTNREDQGAQRRIQQHSLGLDHGRATVANSMDARFSDWTQGRIRKRPLSGLTLHINYSYTAILDLLTPFFTCYEK